MKNVISDCTVYMQAYLLINLYIFFICKLFFKRLTFILTGTESTVSITRLPTIDIPFGHIPAESTPLIGVTPLECMRLCLGRPECLVFSTDEGGNSLYTCHLTDANTMITTNNSTLTHLYSVN